MKLWPMLVILTILCWGAYVPMIHNGQLGFGPKPNALRAFLFVGVAYFLVSLAVLGWMLVSRTEPLVMTSRGVSLSTMAGVLGAIGALGIVFALMYGGSISVVPPLVFAGAPIVSTFVALLWHKPTQSIHPMFFVGIVLAAVGASIVLRFKPS